MSRTYRKRIMGKYRIHGNNLPYDQIDKIPQNFWWGISSVPAIYTKMRDKKWNYKPAKWFKKIMRKEERAKQKNALRNTKELPIFKKRDMWEWS